MVISFVLIAASILAVPVPERGSFRGDVAIEPVGTRGIAIYVDTNDNDSFDQRFLLQVEVKDVAGARHGEHAPWPLYLTSAHVQFEPGYLRVVAPAGAFE